MSRFLHDHPNLEKTLLNTEEEPGLDRDHVIVDKKDYIEALEILDSLNKHQALNNNLKLLHSEKLSKPTNGYNPPPVKKLDPKLRTNCGIKHDSDKPRFDLIPADALEEVAKVYTVGAKKYGDRNWEKGISYGRLYRALLGHAFSWWRGERDDKESKCHHLSAVIFSALGLLHYELNSEKFKKLDDRNEITKT